MRILHTADWHMNNRLGRVDIAPHIVDGLEQIAAVLEREAVDVMVVAGDLFSERSSRDQLRTAVGEIRRVFGPFLQKGGHIVAIAGNHDSELFFETLRDTLGLAAFEGSGARFHITASPQLLVLPGRDGARVQFVLMPYPTARQYLHAPGGEAAYNTLEEKNRLIQARFAATLDELRANLDPSLPAVLVAHAHVRGATGHTLFKISESDDVIFEPQLAASGWDYVAYGHIHRAGEAVAGLSHARYSGSVARLDAAERDDPKSVALVDIGPHGREGEPQFVPLRAREMHQIHIAGAEEVATLAERFPDAREALVFYTLAYRPGTDNLPAMQRAVERVFPLWYGRQTERLAPLNETGSAVVAALSDTQNVAGTVRGFLGERFAEHPHRAALLELAEGLLSED